MEGVGEIPKMCDDVAARGSTTSLSAGKVQAHRLLASSVALTHAKREMMHRELRRTAIRVAAVRAATRPSISPEPTAITLPGFWPSAFFGARVVPVV